MKEKKKKEKKNNMKILIWVTFVGVGVCIIATVALYLTQVLTPAILGSQWTGHGIRLKSSGEIEQYVKENYTPGKVIKEASIVFSDKFTGKNYSDYYAKGHKAKLFTIKDNKYGFEYTCLSGEANQSFEIPSYYELTSCDKKKYESELKKYQEKE